MKEKYVSLISILLIASLLLVGCTTAKEGLSSAGAESSATSAEESSPAEKSSEADDPAKTTDEKPSLDPEGNSITIPAEVNTIISFAPAYTQVLIDLGLAGNLVAVDQQSQAMFPEAAKLPAFDMLAPDIEQIIALAPDLIFISNLTAQGGESPFTSVQDAGIAVAGIGSPNSIEDITVHVQFIADAVGKNAEGKQLVADTLATVEAVRAIGAAIPEENRKTVYFEISALPDLYSFGQGVFLNEMTEILGGKNIFADQNQWIPAAEESIIQAEPDVILTNVTYIEDPIGEVLGRTGWENIPAIQNKAVFPIDPNTSSQANHHVVEALVQMAKAVYPEEFASLAGK